MLGRHVRNIIKESLDDLDWIISSESNFDPNFEFKDFEYWVDLTKLNREENGLVFDYIKNVVAETPKDNYTISGFKTLAHYKGIVVHCGNEDNDYYPKENNICFLTDTWEQDPHKDFSIYVDGREVLTYIKSIEKDKDLDESLNWSDNDTVSWDTDKNFSTDPTFIADPNWTTDAAKSQWVQGGGGGSSKSGEDVNESEEDWSWINDTGEHPNYNGHPQGVVYLHDHDEIDEFCDIIENYNGGELPRGRARENLHRGLEDTRDELESSDYDPSNAVLSASFFVERKIPGILSVGYWGYDVDKNDIHDWLSHGDTFNREYHLYTSLGQVREIFENYQNPELIKESEEDWDWIKDVPDAVPFELAEIGKTYRIEVEDELLRALEACSKYDDIFTRGYYVVVESKREMPHDNIFCLSEIYDEVLGLKLSFLDSDEDYIDVFWVTQEMLNLYER